MIRWDIREDISEAAGTAEKSSDAAVPKAVMIIVHLTSKVLPTAHMKV